jgi:hypothetical protein
MTPLAHSFAKQLVMPIKDRTVWCPEINLAELMSDIHCFEMSAVTEIYEILHQARRVEILTVGARNRPMSWKIILSKNAATN